MVPALSVESKRKLAAAVERTCDLLEDGEHIEKAAASAAIDHGVPPEHLSLLCNAANIAAMEARRQTADSTLEKAANVDVARPENVVKLMIEKTGTGRGQKKCAAYTPSTSDWLPPDQLRQGPRIDQIQKDVVKSAYTKGTTPAEDLQKANLLAKNVSYATQAAIEDFYKIATSLVKGLQNHHGPSLSDLRRDGPALFGKSASAVLDWIEPSVPERTRVEPPRFADLQSTGFKLLKSAVDKYAEMKTLEEMGERTQKVTKWAELCTQSIESNHEKALAVLFGVKSGAIKDVLAYTGINALANQKVEDPVTSPTEVADDTDTVEHEAQLRNIRLAASIGSLMNGDEVIRRFPPSEVTSHYNELARTAPIAMQDQATMRALLRKRLEAGKHAIDPYEIDLIRKIDNSYETNQSQPKVQNVVKP